MLKRIAHGRPFGVAVLAEGLSACVLPQDELRKCLPDVERDEHGHVRLAEVELAQVLARRSKERLRGARAEAITVEQEHRLRAAVRAAHPVRHRVHPRPRATAPSTTSSGYRKAASPAA